MGDNGKRPSPTVSPTAACRRSLILKDLHSGHTKGLLVSMRKKRLLGITRAVPTGLLMSLCKRLPTLPVSKEGYTSRLSGKPRVLPLLFCLCLRDWLTSKDVCTEVAAPICKMIGISQGTADFLYWFCNFKKNINEYMI